MSSEELNKKLDERGVDDHSLRDLLSNFSEHW